MRYIIRCWIIRMALAATGMLAAISLTGFSVHAASFFPDGAKLDLDPELVAQLAVVQPASLQVTGASVQSSSLPYLQIDDMLFTVEYSDGEYAAFGGNKWPGGIVYYQFNSNVSATNRDRFREASSWWADFADLTFIEGQGSGNYIHVLSDTVNSSAVGMMGGVQYLRMVSWHSLGIIAHEIGHALGLWHEHQRSDRDDYVTILYANIESGKEHNFALKSGAIDYGSYDFDSIMHYEKDAFAIPGTGNTIEPRSAYWQYLNTMGQRSYLSELDIEGMIAHYGPVTGGGEEELVVNGDFAANGSGWQLSGDFYADNRFTNYRSAPGYAYLSEADGSPGNNLYGEISQEINIPANATDVTLTFYYKITTEETGSTAYDEMGVNIRVVNGGNYEVQTFSNLDAGSSYRKETIDLTEFAGERVLLGFAASTDYTLPTVFRIDDVSVVAVTSQGNATLVYTGYEVHDGTGGGIGNDDQEVNPDESIDLDVSLRNQGTTRATNIEAFLSSSSPYVNMIDDRVTFDDIDPGQEISCNGDFDFDVAANTPDGYVIQFQVEVVSDQGSWNQSFSIPVRAGVQQTVDLEYAGFIVHDGDTAGIGNGDGQVNPGEEIDLEVYLRNTGSAQATTVKATLSSGSSLLTIYDGSENWPDIDPGAREICNADFDFTVSDTAPTGEMIEFTLSVTSDQGSWTSTFSLEVVEEVVKTAPDMYYLEHRVDDDQVGASNGNGDGKANPGETLQLPVTIGNGGDGDAHDVMVVLETSDPYITITNPDLFYADMASGDVAQISDFDLEISASCPVPHTVTFDLEISSLEGTWRDSFEMIVHEEVIPCTYSISPPSRLHDPEAGSGSVVVTASATACTWSAQSNVSWLTISNGFGRSGNGTVGYLVANNPTTASRTGTLTIAGKTFTVVQAGKSCSMSPGNNEIVKGTSQPQLSWCPDANATWYQIWIGKKDGAGYALYRKKWLQQTGAEWTPDVDLTCGEFAWWVRPWDATNGSGAWMGPGRFGMECCLPAQPTLLTPWDCAPGGDTVEYSWTAVECATWYQLWVSGDEGVISRKWYNTGVQNEDITRAVTGHKFGTYNYWVRGWSPDGMGAWSSKGTTKIGLVEAASLSSAEICWNDACESGATWVQVWINRGGVNVSKDWIDLTTLPGNCYNLPTVLPSGSYTVWMRAWHPDWKAGPWSAPAAFHIP